MADKVHKTKGIVLRTVRYGETSLIVSVFTELFGLQSYLVNGVRRSSAKGSGKANLFQPAAMLDLVVYHNEFRQLQRIREFRWGYLYQHILHDVHRNTVVLFMVELLTRCLKQPEDNPDLFHFTEDALLHLDSCNDKVLANYPLFFALHLPFFLGITPHLPESGQEDSDPFFFDLREGRFAGEMPSHPHFIEGDTARAAAELLKVRQPDELEAIILSPELRRKLLSACTEYYMLHITDFGGLKSLPVLREILR